MTRYACSSPWILRFHSQHAHRFTDTAPHLHMFGISSYKPNTSSSSHLADNSSTFNSRISSPKWYYQQPPSPLRLYISNNPQIPRNWRAVYFPGHWRVLSSSGCKTCIAISVGRGGEGRCSTVTKSLPHLLSLLKNRGYIWEKRGLSESPVMRG